MINAVIRRIGDMMQGFENLSDCHLHCHFSSDSEASPESMIDNAVRLGLSHICFTDHMTMITRKKMEKPSFCWI